ncbi:hypothetical protein [Piscinibacter sakaiensis]|uniref:Uncharacterized protein n=1 Tax=Piscinibacter sakaiensis TaxID=1547922 RepID=A0A0K8P7C2_PISS1|nr:hypothetical protein [Piscinibacter sakaiensis]GAP38522.1 hypothetical protein ISF6_4980 [Piscinibacter sakaiensis]
MTSPTAPDLRTALAIGLADALAFVAGGWLGWQAGRAVGLDFVHLEGWGTEAFVALLPILAGIGLGRWLARAVVRRLLLRAGGAARG